MGGIDDKPVAVDHVNKHYKMFRFLYGVTRVHDTAYMEFVHFVLAICWGIWNLQPWLSVHTSDFARIGDVYFTDVISTIACFYGTTGVGILFYNSSPMTRRWRKNAALRLCSFWAVVLYLHIYNMYFTPSTIVYPLAILGEAWIFWRIRPNNGTP